MSYPKMRPPEEATRQARKTNTVIFPGYCLPFSVKLPPAMIESSERIGSEGNKRE